MLSWMPLSIPLALTLAVCLVPGLARAEVASWETQAILTNEIVYTVDILCPSGGLVCGALDMYSDTQTATLVGGGDLELDVASGTLQFLQDGTQDLMDGVGLRPAFATVGASDLTFAEIPFVGAPMTSGGVVFALTDPIFSAGGPLTVGDHPVSAVVSYSALADIVGPVDAWLPELVLEPSDVTLSGTLRIFSLLPGGGAVYQLQDLSGTLAVANPTTLLGEDVTISVTAEMNLNLTGNETPGGGVPVPAMGGVGTAVLLSILCAAGALLGRQRAQTQARPREQVRGSRRSSRAAFPLLALFTAMLALAGCSDLPAVVVTSPAHGAFVTGASVSVQGTVANVDAADAAVLVNGVPVAVGSGGSFSTTVAIDPAIVFNPIDVTLTDTSNGFVTHARVTAIAGESTADGDYSEESVALRINDSGLDTLEGVVSDLVEFDPADLAPVNAVVLNECIVRDPFFGFCIGSAVVTIVNPPPAISDFGLAMDSMTNFVAADVLVDDLDIHLNINGSGLVPDCGLRIRAATTDILGDYALDPDAADPTTVDVNQLGGVQVLFSNFDDDLSGICDVVIIGDIIQLFLPDIETLFTAGFVDLLADPDGAGPLDSPIADAIETALLGVEISGPIGQSLGVVLETPIFDIPEDTTGLTIGSDTRVLASIGTGPGQCDPPPGTPDLAASFHVDEAFPSFGATSPGGLPYDIGISISTSAFNQLLRAQIECGLLQLSLTEFDFGFGPVPLTTGVLAALIPELGIFPPEAPVVLELRPTLAPLLTGLAGPAGELAELRMGHLVLELRDATPDVERPLLIVAIDFRAGLELAVDAATGQLAPTLTSLAPGDITVSILDNLVQTDEPTLQAVLPTLLSVALPQLGSSLGSFPIPSFLDLELQPVEISRGGQFMSIFANLTAPLLLENGNLQSPDLPADAAGW